MSRRPIALSPDLLKLQNEGYDLDIRNGYLLVRDVPSVDSTGCLRRGTLIMKLTLAGYPPIPEEKSGSPFKYVDTASSRAGTSGLNARIARQRIGIIGLGGSGAFVLDLVAKTEAPEIHLFDGDRFSQHNAFRAPGAPSLEDLAKRPMKVAWFQQVYSNMRNGITAHEVFVRDENLSLLDELDFVFVCVDSAADKRAIIDHLTRLSKPFVETGMGLLLSDGILTGLVRVTSSTPPTRDLAGPHISYADAEGLENEYASNIQIVELNALSAAIAVYNWKRISGFYTCLGQPYYHGFSLMSGEFAVEVAP
jgi:hypothetical protein